MKEFIHCEECYELFKSDELLRKHKKDCKSENKECQRDVVRTQWMEMIYKGSVQLNKKQMLLSGRCGFSKRSLG
jgi:hypothetical protein